MDVRSLVSTSRSVRDLWCDTVLSVVSTVYPISLSLMGGEPNGGGLRVSRAFLSPAVLARF